MHAHIPTRLTGARVWDLQPPRLTVRTSSTSAVAMAQWMSMTRMTSWIFVVSNNETATTAGTEASVENRLPPRHRGSCRVVGHLVESRCDGESGEKAEQIRFFLVPIKIIDSQDIATDNIILLYAERVIFGILLLTLITYNNDIQKKSVHSCTECIYIFINITL